MVITCEHCSTRFHLDEGRIPVRGARVRCSRCKHAFFVAGPGASPDEALHAVAADAAAHPARAPEASGDPAEAPPPGPPGRSASPFAEDEESDWQFNLDPAPHAGDESRLRPPERAVRLDDPRPGPVPRREAPQPDPGLGVESLESFPEPETFGESFAERPDDEGGPSLEDLGSPESWSFFSEEESGRHEAAAEKAPVERTPTEHAAAAVPVQPRSEAARRTRTAAFRGKGLPELARGGGWLLLAALLVLGLYGAARSGRPLPAPAAALQAVGGLSAEELRGRVLENAAAGPVLVVSGAFVNRGASPLLPPSAPRVRLVDENGTALPEATATAGLAVAEARLREETPASLREELTRAAGLLAGRTLAPGERVEFQALFETVPPAAAGFVLETD